MATLELQPAALLAPYRALHARLRAEVASLDAVALAWQPGPDTTSPAGLVRHLLLSERRNLLRARGLDAPRAADEYAAGLSADDLLAWLDAADAFLDEQAHALTAADLARTVSHPHRGATSGLGLVMETYGHLKEHFGHLQLTLQLYRQQNG